MGFPDGSVVKNLTEMQETQVRSLGPEDPLEEEMSTCSSILFGKIPYNPQSRKESDTIEHARNREGQQNLLNGIIVRIQMLSLRLTLQGWLLLQLLLQDTTNTTEVQGPGGQCKRPTSFRCHLLTSCHLPRPPFSPKAVILLSQVSPFLTIICKVTGDCYC